MHGRGGDLMTKPCPRGGDGAFDFEISQIPTLPHLIPSRGGRGLILLGALVIIQTGELEIANG